MAERTIVTLGDTLAALVEGKKYTTLRDILVTMNAVDVAAIFEDMPQDKLPLLFRLLPKELAAETFVEMDPETQELLIQGFSDNEGRRRRAIRRRRRGHRRRDARQRRQAHLKAG